jgi:hypothetical protein
MKRTLTPKKLARLKRRHEVEILYLQGLSQHAIAAKYNVDRSQISRDLKWIQQWWFANTDFEIKKHKIEALKKLDLLERTAWDAWERSMEDAERRKASQRGAVRTAEQVTEGQVGDPRFLQQVERCIKMRLGIIGIATDSARHEHSGPEGEPIHMRIIRYGEAAPGKPFKEVSEFEMPAD